MRTIEIPDMLLIIQTITKYIVLMMVHCNSNSETVKSDFGKLHEFSNSNYLYVPLNLINSTIPSTKIWNIFWFLSKRVLQFETLNRVFPILNFNRILQFLRLYNDNCKPF